MKLRSVWGMMAAAVCLLAACGEKTAYEEKAESDAKQRAEENRAAHESRK